MGTDLHHLTFSVQFVLKKVVIANMRVDKHLREFYTELERNTVASKNLGYNINYPKHFATVYKTKTCSEFCN